MIVENTKGSIRNAVAGILGQSPAITVITEPTTPSVSPAPTIITPLLPTPTPATLVPGTFPAPTIPVFSPTGPIIVTPPPGASPGWTPQTEFIPVGPLTSPAIVTPPPSVSPGKEPGIVRIPVGPPPYLLDSFSQMMDHAAMMVLENHFATIYSDEGVNVGWSEWEQMLSQLWATAQQIGTAEAYAEAKRRFSYKSGGIYFEKRGFYPPSAFTVTPPADFRISPHIPISPTSPTVSPVVITVPTSPPETVIVSPVTVAPGASPTREENGRAPVWLSKREIRIKRFGKDDSMTVPGYEPTTEDIDDVIALIADWALTDAWLITKQEFRIPRVRKNLWPDEHEFYVSAIWEVLAGYTYYIDPHKEPALASLFERVEKHIASMAPTYRVVIKSIPAPGTYATEPVKAYFIAMGWGWLPTQPVQMTQAQYDALVERWITEAVDAYMGRVEEYYTEHRGTLEIPTAAELRAIMRRKIERALNDPYARQAVEIVTTALTTPRLGPEWAAPEQRRTVETAIKATLTQIGLPLTPATPQYTKWFQYIINHAEMLVDPRIKIDFTQAEIRNQLENELRNRNYQPSEEKPVTPVVTPITLVAPASPTVESVQEAVERAVTTAVFALQYEVVEVDGQRRFAVAQEDFEAAVSAAALDAIQYYVAHGGYAYQYTMDHWRSFARAEMQRRGYISSPGPPHLPIITSPGGSPVIIPTPTPGQLKTAFDALNEALDTILAENGLQSGYYVPTYIPDRMYLEIAGDVQALGWRLVKTDAYRQPGGSFNQLPGPSIADVHQALKTRNIRPASEQIVTPTYPTVVPVSPGITPTQSLDEWAETAPIFADYANCVAAAQEATGQRPDRYIHCLTDADIRWQAVSHSMLGHAMSYTVGRREVDANMWNSLVDMGYRVAEAIKQQRTYEPTFEGRELSLLS